MTDIFNGDKPKEPETNQTNTDAQLMDLLASIKNDQGQPKYSDVPAALKALKESQEFIPTLLSEKSQVQKELERMKEELTKRQTLEELTEALKSSPTNKSPETTTTETPKGVGVEDVEKLLEERLKARDQEAQRNSNLKTVVDALTSKYGDKATEHIQKTAEQVGSTTEELKALASSNPKLALRLLDVGGSSQSPKPVSSTTGAPRVISDDNPPPKFEKGVARGGFTDRELAELWRVSSRYTNKRIGVEN